MKRALLASTLLLVATIALGLSLLGLLLDELPQEVVTATGCVEDCTGPVQCPETVLGMLDAAVTGGRCTSLQSPLGWVLGGSSAILLVLLFTNGPRTRSISHLVYAATGVAAYIAAGQVLTETRDIFGGGEPWYASSDEWTNLTAWLVRLSGAAALMLIAVAAGAGSRSRRERRRREQAAGLRRDGAGQYS